MENFKITSIFIYDWGKLSNRNSILYFYPQNLSEKTISPIIDFIQECTILSNYFSEDSNDNLILINTINTCYLSKKYEEKYLTMSIRKEKKSTDFFHNIEINRHYFKKLIDHLYESLILYNNTFSDLFNPIKNKNFSVNASRLNEFIRNYIEIIENIKLPIVDFLQYFPLSDVDFTNIISSLQSLNEKLPEMKFSSVFFKGFLVYNELPLDTISILHNKYYSNTNQNQVFNFKSLITSDFFSQNSLEDCIISLYIKNKNMYEEVKFLPFYVEGFLLFLFFKSNVNLQNLFNKCKKLEKWVKKYFKQNIEVLNKNYSQILPKKDNLNFFYLNHSNKSIKISTFYFSKEKILDEKKFENINFLFRNCSHKKNSSLTNLNQSFFYFNISIEREFILSLNEDVISYDRQINESKKFLFERIFII